MSAAAVLALLLTPVMVGVAVAAHDLIRRPGFRRIALRNVRRRRGEAALVILGSMLGTAIIGAAFVVGDSFNGSIRDVARTTLGPVDEIVRIRPPAGELDRRLGELYDRLSHTSLPGVDGMTTASLSSAVVISSRTDAEGNPRTEPSGCLGEMSFAAGRRFGGDRAATGLADAGPDPTADEAVINDELATTLGVRAGDRIDLLALGQRRPFTVRTVLPTVGLAGLCDVFVADGTLNQLVGAAAGGDGTQLPSGVVLVSNRGGVFDGADGTDAVKAALTARLADLEGVSVETPKQETLRRADEQGSSLRSILSAVGGFSLMAGVLLLVNLFVMLAEERSTELGILRAVGMKRQHLWRTFSLEGGLYSLVSGVLGALAGIGVGWLVIVGTRAIFAERGSRFSVDLFVRWPTLALVAAIGATISLVTVWATSVRIARLNVISAIRELPDPRRSRRSWQLLAALGVVVAVGGGLLWAGLAGSPIALMLGVPVMATGLAGLAVPYLPRSVTVGGAGAVTIAWVLVTFVAFPDQMRRPPIGVFVVMGVTLVFAAVAIGSRLEPWWRRVGRAAARTPRGVAVRLGMTYPLARPFRTSLLLAMYSLVVFTLTFIGTFATTVRTQTASSAADIAAGNQLLVDSNRANPATTADLERQPGVAAAVSVVRGAAEFTIRYRPQPTQWAVTGIDRTFTANGVPVLEARLDRFGDDRAAFDALVADPSLIIVNDRFLQTGDTPSVERPRPGDRVEMINLAGDRRAVTVAGVLRSDFVGTGSYLARDLVSTFLPPAVAENRAYLTLTAEARGGDGASGAARRRAEETVARRLQAALVANGATVRTFDQSVDEVLQQQNGFLNLLQVYLGLGLLVGIAGLGVVMVRAVRERRREIGMLRAMGFSGTVVRRAFLVEATFVATQAVLIGVGLGMLTCWQVTVNAGAFSNARLSFAVSPWQLAGLLVIPVAASLLATVVPARRAAAIRPAVALRVTE